MDRNNSPLVDANSSIVEEPKQAEDAPTPAEPADLLQSPVPEQQKPQSSSAGIIVLQWLSYAFWGWLIIALIWLVGVVASAAIADADVEDMIPYAIAATVVLLPIAFLTDLFYRRHEPIRKTGAATVIMVIHVVIFALLGIGALITTVFTVLSMFIGTGGNTEGQTAAVITELIAAVLYAAVFLRILNPFKTKRFARIYGFAMLSVALIILTLGILGPMLKAVSQRDDRRIETNLPLVQSSISTYVDDNGKLPNSLKDVTYSSSEARSLVDDGLVRYQKVASATQKTTQAEDLLINPDYPTSSSGYRYKLCVTYTGSSNKSDYNSYSLSQRDEYQDYLSIYSHPAGEVCYKLEATGYGSSINL